MTRQEYTALVDRAKQLSYEYYVLAKPSVSDEQFDALVSEIEQTESEHPEWVLPDSPTQMVGSDLQDNGRRLIRHRTRMLSCQKAQTQEAVTKWLAQTEKKLGAQVYALEWKYDGISCSLVYQDGQLTEASTRGDGGIMGQDLLDHVRLMTSVPQQICATGRMEVRGEIVCPKSVLSLLGYKDCRTAAAALTNQVCPSDDMRHLAFLAWQADIAETESASMVAVQQLGFACDIRTCDGKDVIAMLNEYSGLRESLPYPTDGVVIKIDNKAVAASLGYTEHHPKGNIAFKFFAQGAVTQVVGIEIKVGATGRRTPVAQLVPVMIMGREVKSVSLGSENKMRELGVTEGCTVEVVLANDVIPKVARVIPNTDCTERTDVAAETEKPQDARYDVITESRNDEIKKSRNHEINETRKQEIKESTDCNNGHKVMTAIGTMAAMSVALIIIWQSGLIIPVGIAGLITCGMLK